MRSVRARRRDGCRRCGWRGFDFCLLLRRGLLLRHWRRNGNHRRGSRHIRRRGEYRARRFHWTIFARRGLLRLRLGLHGFGWRRLFLHRQRLRQLDVRRFHQFYNQRRWRFDSFLQPRQHCQQQHMRSNAAHDTPRKQRGIVRGHRQHHRGLHKNQLKQILMICLAADMRGARRDYRSHCTARQTRLRYTCRWGLPR